MNRLIKILAPVLLLLFIALIALNSGKKVNTTWTQADFDEALNKTKIRFDSITSVDVEHLYRRTFTTSGRVHVNNSFTAAEVTSLIAVANDTRGAIKDVAVSFGPNNTGEVSFKVSAEFIKKLKEERFPTALLEGLSAGPESPKGLLLSLLAAPASVRPDSKDLTDYTINLLTTLAANKPIYAKGKLERYTPNSVTINIEEVRVGQVPLPQATLRTVEYHVGVFVNTLLTAENGFSIQELRVDNGKLFYQGSLPAEIRGTKLP